MEAKSRANSSDQTMETDERSRLINEISRSWKDKNEPEMEPERREGKRESERARERGKEKIK